MSYPPDDERYAALARYLAGECTPSESARIQRLLAEEPDRAKAMKALAGMMTRLEPPPMAPVDVDGAWLRVRDRMRDAEVAEAVPEAVEPAPQPEAPVVEMVVEAVEPAPEPEAPVVEMVVEAVEPAPQPEAPVVEMVVEAVEPAPEPEAPVVEMVVEAVEPAPQPEAPVVEMVVEAVTVTAEPEAPARAPWWSAAVSAATRAGAALWKWVRGGR
ncbi:MAG TPA: hypothetical protein PKA50_00250 [Gemmatimonadales bacterium]|nr:hypothetical protein [Gemmatimonadales bacterium]